MIFRPLSTDSLATAAALWGSGKDTREIALHLRINEAAVYRDLERIRAYARRGR